MAVRVTMHDVARLAGVSQRTVSNVVNEFPHVAPETRERVQQAIGTLNYRPHVTAQSLRGGRTGIVALALPDLSAPYFAEMADLIQQEAQRRGVTLLIDQTRGTRERELLVLDGYQSNLVDGIILNPIALSAADLDHRGLEVPVVLLGERFDDSTFAHVSIDNVAAARLCVEHLVAGGRQRIAAVGSPTAAIRSGPAVPRHRGYTRAMGAAGLPTPPELVFELGPWDRKIGYDLAQPVLDVRPRIDAVFCFNDSLALGLMKGLTDAGVHIPDDIAVVGWDDIEEAAYGTPRLTTVAPDRIAIATAAVDGVLQTEAALADPVPHIGFRLVVRESTGWALPES